MLRGNRVLDSAFACCTGDLGSIPAGGKSKKCKTSDGFFFLSVWGGRAQNGARYYYLHYLPSPLSSNDTNPMGQHSCSCAEW